ncbi:MAG: DUF2950 family protein [Planctomycetes bacterium]|nr:DUF2950 family protein [Planctomycetota bacterium]
MPWYIKTGREVEGPLMPEEIQRRIQDGSISWDTWVSTDGKSYRPANEVLGKNLFAGGGGPGLPAPASAPSAAPAASSAPSVPDAPASSAPGLRRGTAMVPPPSPQPAYVPHRASSEPPRQGVPLARVLLWALVLVGLPLAAYFVFFKKTPATAMADAPKNSSAAVTLGHPKELVRDALKSAKDTASTNPFLASALASAKGPLDQALGFDSTDVDRYGEAGIDLDQRISVVLLETDPAGSPTGLVLGVGVTDETKALETVKRIATNLGMGVAVDSFEGVPVHVIGKQMSAAVAGQRLYLCSSPGTQSKAELMRKFLNQREDADLSQHLYFKSAMEQLKGNTDLVGFVNVKNLAGASGEALALAFDGRMDANEQEWSAFLLMKEGSELSGLLEPGAPCKEMLARMPKPAAAISTSLKNPVGLARYAVTRTLGEQAYAQQSQRIAAQLGVDPSELSTLLMDASLSVLFYPGSTPNMPVGVAVLLKVNNRARVADVLAHQLGNDPAWKKSANGADVLYELAGIVPLAVGLSGDYLIAGNAFQELRGLLGGASGGWQPPFGDGELFAMEVDAGSMASMLKTQPFLSSMMKNAPSSGYFSSRVAVTPKGLRVDSKATGQGALAAVVPAAVVTAVLVPNLTSPGLSGGGSGGGSNFGRSRMAANESAAIACCKTFSQAQDIYRRTDWDGDGVLEYAQAMSGDFSLFEKSAGQADLCLIDAAFADASSDAGYKKPKAGYFFKVLKQQGASASMGARSYVPDNKNMTLGYAVVAFPSEYDVSGRNTFLINNTGVVYQKDLGPGTGASAQGMTQYDPDQTWVVAE